MISKVYCYTSSPKVFKILKRIWGKWSREGRLVIQVTLLNKFRLIPLVNRKRNYQTGLKNFSY